MSGEAYEPRAYWEQRFSRKVTLETVGFRGLGLPFNEALYRQRRIVLGRALRRHDIRIAGSDIVELGPGSGFYVDIWRRLGARRVTGLEIAEPATRSLRHRYPGYEFHQADVTTRWPIASGSADVVAAFDVLFHVTDDSGFERALGEAARVLRPGGWLLVSDLFVHNAGFRRFHQVARSVGDWDGALSVSGLRAVRRYPVFVTMQPAVDVRNQRVRAAADRWWRWIEGHLRDRSWSGRRSGQVLGMVDRLATRVLREGPSIELLVARRVGNRGAAPHD